MLLKNNFKVSHNLKRVNSKWINKVQQGKTPNSQDLLEHLHIIHNYYAGFTEKIAKKCCDLNGKNSYELLLDTIDIDYHTKVLDLACGSGALLELCHKRFPLKLKLSGVDINGNELKLAQNRLADANINFYKAKAQELNFIKNASQDVIFCHWALTLMDPVVPVLETIKRLLKNQGIFSAIVDGEYNSAPGYLEIHNIIYDHVQKELPNYGLIELGDARVRSVKSLKKLIKETFVDYEINITSHLLSFKQSPKVLAKEVSGFFYASLVLPSESYKILISSTFTALSLPSALTSASLLHLS